MVDVEIMTLKASAMELLSFKHRMNVSCIGNVSEMYHTCNILKEKLRAIFIESQKTCLGR